jgi:predicted ATPase
VVTFLFTDVEGSTASWAADSDAMAASLAVHDDIVREAVDGHGGYVFTTAGDSFAVAFQSATQGLEAAREAQRRLAYAEWPGPALRVRMGIHLGEAVERGGDYFGPVVNLTARLEAAGHGGQVLITDAVRAATGVSTLDLGTHQLRDIPDPVLIHQMGDDVFPALRIIESNRTNLPVAPTRLIGRDRQLATLREALASSRLVTLTAAGGTGKTRLALAAGEELLPHRAGGVWFADLSTVDAESAIPTTIAAAVGLQLSGADRTRQVVDYLAGIDALVILDNCEHLVDGCADFIETLLQTPGETTILATTREFFDIDGEQTIRLPALASGDADSPAVDLFVERAVAADSTLTFDDDDLATVADLCRHLDGSPLAIELAASRCGVMTPAELLAAIGERFELLRGGRRRRTRQTLEDTLTWSYDLLDDEEQQMFRALAVFAGSFDLRAAGSVANISAGIGIDLVEALVAKSLVVAERVDHETRFRLLETPAAYAERLLHEHDETDTTRDRHLDHFLAVAEPLAVGIMPTTAAVRELGADRANLLAAIEWARTREQWPEVCRLLFASYEAISGQADVVARISRGALENGVGLDETDIERARAALLGASIQLDDFGTVAQLFTDVSASDDPVRRAMSTAGKAWLTLSVGEPAAALDSLQSARHHLSGVSDEIARLQVAGQIEMVAGWAHAHLCDFASAVTSYREARDLLAELPQPTQWLGQALASEAMALAELGDDGAALELADVLAQDESVYANAEDVRIVAHLLRGDGEAADPYLKAQALDAVTGRLSRAANDVLLFLALRAEHKDKATSSRLLMSVEQTRTVWTIATSLALANRLGVRPEFDESRARGRENRAASGRRAIEALRAEFVTLGWG